MWLPSISRYESCGVTLLGDTNRPSGVTFAFTERTGGVSKGEFSSLNLGSRCGDAPEAVATNRARALEALGAADFAGMLVEPKQVHGDHIVVVGSNAQAEIDAVRSEAQVGADAVVCTASGVPVLLCFADCVPVVLVAQGAKPGFAVVHSGWRGTLARISAKAAAVLAQETGSNTQDMLAYVGPHILGSDYEVSSDLIETFTAEFGSAVLAPGTERNLDMSAAIAMALKQAGLKESNICDCAISTAQYTDRFYSYRKEQGKCGRHAAIAYMAAPAGKCS